MTTLAGMLTDLSGWLRKPESAIEAYTKPLRKAGKLTSGKRGRGAVDLTVEDAASIIIAMMGGSTTKAVDVLEKYSRLESRFDYPGAQAICQLLEISTRHSFFQMISSLIVSAAKPTFEEDITKSILSSYGLAPQDEHINDSWGIYMCAELQNEYMEAEIDVMIPKFVKDEPDELTNIVCRMIYFNPEKWDSGSVGNYKGVPTVQTVSRVHYKTFRKMGHIVGA